MTDPINITGGSGYFRIECDTHRLWHDQAYSREEALEIAADHLLEAHDK